MLGVIQNLCCCPDSPLADSKQHNQKLPQQDFEDFKNDVINVINNNENIYFLREGNLLNAFIRTCKKTDDNSYKNMIFTLYFDNDIYGNRIIKASLNGGELQSLSTGCSNDNILHFINAFLIRVKFPLPGRIKPELSPKAGHSEGIDALRRSITAFTASHLFRQRQSAENQTHQETTEHNKYCIDQNIILAPPARSEDTLYHQRILPLRIWLNDFLSEISRFPATTTESFFNYCFIVFGVVQKINILDSSQSDVKKGANSEAALAALIEHLELINPSDRLSPNTRLAMLQLSEEEWSEFFYWLLNSLECLDYVIINLTPESKKTLMSEHRNNIQVAIDALYSQRRRKSPGDDSEMLTRRNDVIFGNHVWQTFAQYFPPGLEKPSV